MGRLSLIAQGSLSVRLMVLGADGMCSTGCADSSLVSVAEGAVEFLYSPGMLQRGFHNWREPTNPPDRKLL